MKFTIKDNATDQEYTDTIENLVEFVNNNNASRADGFTIINGSRFSGVNPNPSFKLWLSHRGYTFNVFGQAIKSVK